MGYAIHETTMSSGGESSGGTDSRGGKRTWIVLYDATTLPADLHEVETLAELPVPSVDTLPGDSTRVCRKNTAKPVAGTGKTIYTVDTDYETGEGADSPLDRPDKIVEFNGSKTSKTIFTTEDEDPEARVAITTSAGEPFEKLAEQTTADFKLVIEGNREGLDPALIVSFLKPNAVNDAAFTVRGIEIGEGEAKLVGINATPQTENGVNFWRYRWEIELAETWVLEVDDRGFYELDDDDELREITHNTPPVKVSAPWPLDGEGAAKPNPDDLPEQLHFTVQPVKDFSVWDWTAAA